MNLLEKILKETKAPNGENNAVNTLEDISNLRVLVWTFPKTGTMTLCRSFQNSIDGTVAFKNVVHCHTEKCWFSQITKDLQKIDFSFESLIKFINSKGIHPLVVQSYRCPVEKEVPRINHRLDVGILPYEESYSFFRNYDGEVEYINYLKNTFNGIWKHNYDKEKSFGFHHGSEYDILYLTCESINDLPNNIKSTPVLKEYHNIEIQNTNIREGDKNYTDFKNNFSLSVDDIETMYNIHSEPLNFFYTSDKILKMKQKVIKKYVKHRGNK